MIVRIGSDLGGILLGTVLLAGMLLTPLACQAQADIIPGRSIWKQRLGMSPQALRRSVAFAPDDVWHTRDGITAEEWDPDTTVLLRQSKVIQIIIANLNESTPDGISGRSSLATVLDHYKGARLTTEVDSLGPDRKVDGRLDTYDDQSRGIAFVFFTPRDPKASSAVESIIVHFPGRPVVSDWDKLSSAHG